MVWLARKKIITSVLCIFWGYLISHIYVHNRGSLYKRPNSANPYFYFVGIHIEVLFQLCTLLILGNVHVQVYTGVKFLSLNEPEDDMAGVYILPKN